MFFLETCGLSKAPPLGSASLQGSKFTFPVICLTSSVMFFWHLTVLCPTLSQPFFVNSSAPGPWVLSMAPPITVYVICRARYKMKRWGLPVPSLFSRSLQHKHHLFPGPCPEPSFARIPSVHPMKCLTSVPSFLLLLHLKSPLISFLLQPTRVFLRHTSETLIISPLPVC